VQERDGHRLDAAGAHLVGQLADLARDERPLDRAIGQHALVELEPPAAPHQRARHLEVDVVQIVAVLAADLDRITEAARRDQRRARAAPLDQRVGHQGRAVDHLLDAAGGDARGRQYLG
jgi:hypothetical protein